MVQKNQYTAAEQGDRGLDPVTSAAGNRPGRRARRTPDPASFPAALVVAGPTASGKSALASALAEALGGVVINGDSQQCYRDLRILTARPDHAAEMRVPHRLYGFLDAARRGSAAEWRRLAVDEIAAATATGRLAIVVGGTGLYLRALTRGLAPIPEIPATVREEASALYRAVGAEGFRRRLAELDADSARRLAPADRQRLVRAYEVVRATGETIGAWRTRPHSLPPFRFMTILLAPPRQTLYAACDARFSAMIEAGGLDEAAALAARALAPDLPAMKAVGVPELLRHLRGEIGLGEAVAFAQRATRRYAKRQETWFRRQMVPDLVCNEQFSERLLRCSRQFICSFLLTGTS